MDAPVARLMVAGVVAALVGGCAGGAGTPDASPRHQRDWTAHPAVVTVTGAQEIDALGDVHGDPDAAFRSLAAAGLITKTSPIHWSGGSRILVVTGDIIDKGATALPVIDLLIALEPEARAAGGRVIVTLGNHEAEFLAAPADPKSAVFQAELAAQGLQPGLVAAGQGVYGAWLLNLPVAVLIDDWFFCHAGDSEGETAAAIAQKFRKAFEGRDGFGDSFLTGKGSLLEANAWWLNSASPTSTLDAYLAALPARHIVFGHDPGDLTFPAAPEGDRARGQMVARYGGRLFLIDVGMSYAVGYSGGALLRIIRSGPDAATATAVPATGATTPLWP